MPNRDAWWRPRAVLKLGLDFGSIFLVALVFLLGDQAGRHAVIAELFAVAILVGHIDQESLLIQRGDLALFASMNST